MGRKWCLILLLIVVLPLACTARDNTPAANDAVENGADGADAAPFAIEPVTESVTMAGADDLMIHGTFYAPAASAPLPGILLLHMLSSSQQAWVDSGVTTALVDAGYAVLAVDMRGHGGTGGSKDWELARQDLQRVWAYLTERAEVDAEQTAVVGASIGANMALVTAADQTAIKSAVLLSPGLDYAGVRTEPALAEYGERPLLVVASAEDAYAASSSRTLHESAAGDAELEMYDGAGHGTRMFAARPELTMRIIEWLEQYVK